MATIFSRPEQTYNPLANGNPRVFTFTPTIGPNANIKEFAFTLTHVNWPAGPVAQIVVDYPDGTNALTAELSGGPSRFPASIVGLRTTDALPKGTYTITCSVIQSFTTALTVDVN